jgi:CubicO group peptidase (beta-lactamase class C family)
MTEDTIFDLASLTKVIATSTAVMQLVEQRKLRLDDTVERYWPEFGSNGKKEIRVRHLLTHTTGLRAGLNGNSSWSGYRAALKQIEAEMLLASPGERFLYSDINLLFWVNWLRGFRACRSICTARGISSPSSV